jgi:hypothetical protein
MSFAMAFRTDISIWSKRQLLHCVFDLLAGQVFLPLFLEGWRPDEPDFAVHSYDMLYDSVAQERGAQMSPFLRLRTSRRNDTTATFTGLTKGKSH